jgi:cytochrome P450/NADPH-cytochrome P450 reductase
MKMKYCSQVIKEVLRVYPPMPVTVRNSLKDGRLGPYRVSCGDIIFVGTLAAHRNKTHWGPHPDRFDPSNFDLEKVLNRHKHAFIPFSVGQRQCMAQEVSFMMMRVAMFYIWNTYKIRNVSTKAVVKKCVVTTSPLGVTITRIKREGKEARVKAIEDRKKATAEAQARVKQAALSNQAALDEAADLDESWKIWHDVPKGASSLLLGFGSNFGTNKDLCSRLEDAAQSVGFETEVTALNNFPDAWSKSNARTILICTSTYTGNPPSNSTKFKAWLDQQSPDERWKQTKFAVFGTGNSQVQKQ